MRVTSATSQLHGTSPHLPRMLVVARPNRSIVSPHAPEKCLPVVFGSTVIDPGIEFGGVTCATDPLSSAACTVVVSDTFISSSTESCSTKARGRLDSDNRTVILSLPEVGALLKPFDVGCCLLAEVGWPGRAGGIGCLPGPPGVEVGAMRIPVAGGGSGPARGSRLTVASFPSTLPQSSAATID